MDHLLSIELTSPAYGYRLVNDLPSEKDCRLVEATALNGDCFWIFLTGDRQALQEVAESTDQTNPYFKKMALLAEVDPAVKSALYSLQQEKVRDFLAVAECRSVTDAIETAHLVTKPSAEVRLIEIVNVRGLTGLSLVYFTGRDASAAEKQLSEIKTAGKLSHYEVIAPVSPALADYFNIENV